MIAASSASRHGVAEIQIISATQSFHDMSWGQVMQNCPGTSIQEGISETGIKRPSAIKSVLRNCLKV